MSTSQRPLRLDGADRLRSLIDQWTESLAQVLESMTDRSPEIHWQGAGGKLAEARAANPDAAGTDSLWWDQPFLVAPDAHAWIAAAREAWEFIGSLTLKAAGLEKVETGEARNTWLEILGQSLGGMARSMTAMLGREVACDTGVERAPVPEPEEWAAVSIQLGDTALPRLWLALSPQLASLIATPPEEPSHSSPSVLDESGSDVAAPDAPPERSRTMDLLLDVDLPISISFGRTQLPMKDVLKLTTGSIVELNRGVNDAVEVLVNQCLIARGEVVVVDGNYGVRIQQIASRQDRLRSIR